MIPEAERLAQLEEHLGWLLITGVMLSAACLAVGLVLLLVAPSSAWAADLLAAGLMILIATPMLRVVVSIVEYIRMGEWLFVMTTVVVLIELAASVFYALRR
jgi:uncharacterized membrane protein